MRTPTRSVSFKWNVPIKSPPGVTLTGALTERALIRKGVTVVRALLGARGIFWKAEEKTSRETSAFDVRASMDIGVAVMMAC